MSTASVHPVNVVTNIRDRRCFHRCFLRSTPFRWLPLIVVAAAAKRKMHKTANNGGACDLTFKN